MASPTANHATVIPLVQVDVSVDQLENSVHVNLVIQVLSVISVTQDIMDSLTAEGVTVIGLDQYHQTPVMRLLASATVVKCTLPDNALSVVGDFTAFLNVTFVTVMLKVQLEISVIQTLVNASA